MRRAIQRLSAYAALIHSVYAQSCSNQPSPSSGINPTIASGYRLAVVATGLTSPRSLEFDSEGNLLVVEQEKGISSHVLQDNGGTCVTVKSSKDLIKDKDLNHGLALSPDGKTLYASSVDEAFSWTYDASASSTSNKKTLVQGMGNGGHSTRTLLLTKQVSDMLVVSRGSQGNLDYIATDKSSGHCQLKAFNLSSVPDSGHDFTSDGLLLGWGLRNEVGIGEHPDGGIWGVENSVDMMRRDGEDIHEDNPGEELNFFGYLNGTKSANQGANFGYPTCFAAWNVQSIKDNEGFQTGSQFASDKSNDTLCKDTMSPRLTFQAHTAPLDIKFNATGTAAWITFHGSWNRDDPVGYDLSLIPFDSSTGQPLAPSTSTSSAQVIVGNKDLSQCPDKCLRPVGIAFDKQGRLFFTSDASGEIYVLVNDNAPTGGDRQTGGSGGNGGGESGAGGGDTGTRGPSGGSGTGVGSRIGEGGLWVFMVAVVGWIAAYVW